MPSRPDVKALGDIYEYNFREEEVKARMSHLRDTSDGLKGELELVTYRQNEEPFIHYANINLLSTRSRRDISRYAGSRVNNIDWDGILECICDWTVQYHRQGEPVQKAGNTKDDSPVQYTLYPVIVEGETNILYGYGGTGKSYLACLWGLLVQTGCDKLGFKAKKGNVLYLDYESSFRELNKRIMELKKGMELPPETELYYRRCYQPIADDIEAIRSTVLENDINLVIVDSIGPACGGEPETADSALRYFRAMRSLGTTNLNISHRTKREDTKGPFGSVYWLNLARYIWTAELGDLPQRDRFTVNLQHEKTNITGYFSSMSLEFTFYPDDRATLVNKIDVEELPTSMANLPLEERIKRMLGKHGEMTEEELADILPTNKNGKKTTPGSVRATCNNNKKLFEKVGGRWRLRAINE